MAIRTHEQFHIGDSTMNLWADIMQDSILFLSDSILLLQFFSLLIVSILFYSYPILSSPLLSSNNNHLCIYLNRLEHIWGILYQLHVLGGGTHYGCSPVYLRPIWRASPQNMSLEWIAMALLYRHWGICSDSGATYSLVCPRSHLEMAQIYQRNYPQPARRFSIRRIVIIIYMIIQYHT